MINKALEAFPLPLEQSPLPIRIDHASGGAVRVGPTRMTLEVVLTSYHMGYTPEEIVRQFDSLQLADVYATIGHYLRHRAAFDAYLAECNRLSDERCAHAIANGQAGLKDRLLARLAGRQDSSAQVGQ